MAGKKRSRKKPPPAAAAAAATTDTASVQQEPPKTTTSSRQQQRRSGGTSSSSPPEDASSSSSPLWILLQTLQSMALDPRKGQQIMQSLVDGTAPVLTLLEQQQQQQDRDIAPMDVDFDPTKEILQQLMKQPSEKKKPPKTTTAWEKSLGATLLSNVFEKKWNLPFAKSDFSSF